GHVEGFNDLSEAEQDEFIELFRWYTRVYKKIDESSIASIYLTEGRDYHVMFLDQAKIVLNINKVKHLSKKKNSTVQVAMSAYTHKKVKEMALRDNKGIQEIVTTACECYMKHYDRKT